MKRTLIILGSLVVLGGSMMIPVGEEMEREEGKTETVEIMSMKNFPKERPAKTLRLLFIHHSCGGQLLAGTGTEDGDSCIYKTHQNGGGLRELLVRNGYDVHEASYNSEIGDRTDIFDWKRKFEKQMDKVLTCDHQNEYYSDGRENQIVVFKSCYPNNLFSGEGSSPGNPNGPELTVWNAKAAYDSLLDEFAKKPGVLFVAVTAPPVANHFEKEPLWKALARKVLSREKVPSGPLARSFNNWLKAENGWLKNYSLSNVAVFDYYDILTKNGRTNYSAYPTDNGTDSHPSTLGNEIAAREFVPFLNAHVRRAGLTE